MKMHWKKINSFLRLRITDNFLDVTDPIVTPRMVDFIKKYMKENNVDGLGIGDPFCDCDDLSFLKEFSNLKALGISYSNFNIESINNYTQLESLSIPFGFRGAIDFTHFPKLRSVYLNWQNKGVDSLFRCPQLEEVYIHEYDGLTLSDFEVFSKLKKLELYEARKIISLDGIGRLKNLEEFRISCARKLKDLGDIEDAQNLKKLWLHGAKQVEDLTPIMYLKNLRILLLDTLGPIPTIKFLAPLKNLEEFYMAESTNVQDGDLSVLEHLRNHHKLDKVGFTNRRHYSHTREQLGFELPPEVAALLKKKK